MEIKIKDGILEVWETGSKNNKLIWRENQDIMKLNRSRIFYILNFLKQNSDRLDLIEDITSKLGKSIEFKNLPKRIDCGNYCINIDLNYLLDSLKDYEDKHNLNLNPDFQRGHVWTYEQRISFVEYYLTGGEVQPIMFNHSDWMRFEDRNAEMVIVDGKQRLTALTMFLKDELLVFKELDKDGIGFKSSEFDTLSRRNIRIYINDLKTEKEVLQWYLQINEGGTPHTKDELDKVKNMIKELGDGK